MLFSIIVLVLFFFNDFINFLILDTARVGGRSRGGGSGACVGGGTGKKRKWTPV